MNRQPMPINVNFALASGLCDQRDRALCVPPSRRLLPLTHKSPEFVMKDNRNGSLWLDLGALDD